MRKEPRIFVLFGTWKHTFEIPFIPCRCIYQNSIRPPNKVVTPLYKKGAGDTILQ